MSAQIERQTTDRLRQRLRAPVDVYESDDGLLLRADLPGVTPEGLDVQLDHGILTVLGARPVPEHHGGGRVQYHRRIQVPRYIDPAKVTAHLERGVLTVTLPKAESARPRTIPIQRG